MRTVRLLCSLFLAAFLVLALASYRVGDLALAIPANKGGLLGAYLAQQLLSTFGLVAWLIPGIILWCAFLDLRRKLRASVFLGWLCIVFTLTYFVEITDFPFKGQLPNSTGGGIGSFIAVHGSWLIGKHGTFVAACCLLFGSSCLISERSFIQWAEDKFKIRPEAVRDKSSGIAPAAKKQKQACAVLPEPVPADSKKAEQEEAWQLQGQKLIAKLKEYGVQGKITAIVPGPVIVRFELQLAAGERGGKVVALSKDLARALKLAHVRVIENIPGKSALGLEIPTPVRQVIPLKPLLEQAGDQLLPLALGVCAEGHPVVVDLTKLPHLLVAGSTGSGKSVGMNAMLLSLITQRLPEEMRLVLIDPKILEFARYQGIAHLACPVICEPHQAFAALKWCVGIMDERYRLLAKTKVRHINEYHRLQSRDTALPSMPYLVIVVDELADLMMITKKCIEEPIARLAQKARACGIHLILATQRPSVDVITGLIKANVPARLAFAVSSKIDSRTIIDQQGAEHLLGMGDAYLLQAGEFGLKRVHGAFVSDQDCEQVLLCWKEKQPEYLADLSTICSQYLDEDGS